MALEIALVNSETEATPTLGKPVGEAACFDFVGVLGSAV
jgi:hypothetical protein